MRNQIPIWGIEQPRKLFLIDGAGAILSAFLLGIVLVKLEGVFGIPRPTLYTLALIPCLFAVYDIYGYYAKSKMIKPFLRGIALMNVAYCILSLSLAIYHFQKLTFFGWSYIILEIILVATLAVIELNAASGVTHREQVSE